MLIVNFLKIIEHSTLILTVASVMYKLLYILYYMCKNGMATAQI